MTTPEANVRLFLAGHADDLYALSVIFPEGAYPGVHVVTAITGERDGLFRRVSDASNSQTYVTGGPCLGLIDAGFLEAEDLAWEVLAPLNGYAALLDSNFTPVAPISASWTVRGGSGGRSFSSRRRSAGSRLITVDWHPKLAELRQSRVDYMIENPLAAQAALVLGGPASWAEYYRLLEDIAGHLGTSLDKLSESGLAERPALNAFKKAANNRAFARHGASKRDATLDEEDMMNLLEAREFVRNVVSAWLDIECGDRLPRNRVDGGPLRFGLDQEDLVDQKAAPNS